MKRVLVIGPGGAGKTVFSKRLGEVLNLPVIHLDALYWRAGWQPTPSNEWHRIVKEVTSGPSWIMDGNYGGTLRDRLLRADSVIFLDLPRLTCVARVLWRRILFSGGSRPSMAEGCPERVTWEFIHWIWAYGKRKRPGLLAQLKTVESEKAVVILRSTREVRKYLSGLGTNCPHDQA